MKRFNSLFAGILAAFIAAVFAACSFGVTEKDYGSNTPGRTGDSDSIVVNEIYEDENGEQWVKISMNATNTLIKDARTLMPDKPELYFSVVGSTAFADDGAGANASNGVRDDDEDADCSATMATTSGNIVISPYYATAINQTTGITLTLKVGKSYYLTAYGTSTIPSTLSTSNFMSYDCTTSTIYTDFTGKASIVGKSDSDTSEEIYNTFREQLITLIKNDAVVKGTAHIYVGVSNTGDIEFRQDDSSGTVLTSISITTSSKGITGVGQPVILIDLPATSGGSAGDASYTLQNSARTINAIEVKWTPKTSGVAGSFVVDVSDWKSTGKLAEFKPWVAVGEYDMDITFYNSTAAQVKTGTKNDVFALHDTLIVWKNQKSKILGTSSYYSAEKTTADLAKDGTTSGSPSDKDRALIADSVQNLDSGTIYTDSTHPCKAYVFTAEDVVKNQRTVFYVSDGTTLTTGNDTTGNGSLFAPYATVQKAVTDIIAQRAAGYDAESASADDATDWNIVVDHAEQTSTAVRFTNIAATYTGVTLPDGSTSTIAQASAAAAKGMNLTIRAFKASDRAALAEDFTFINANGTGSDVGTGTPALTQGAVRLFLTNVDWDGSGKTFTLGADAYLSNTSICSDIGTPAAGAGKVVLNTACTVASKESGNGTFYVDAENDATSTVMNIEVNDDNATPGGGYNHNVLSYQYHAVNTVNTGSEKTFLSKMVADPEDDPATPTVNAASRFIVSGTYYTSDANNAGGIKKVLDVDTEVGAATYGCIIVKVKDISVSTPFSAGMYRGTVGLAAPDNGSVSGGAIVIPANTITSTATTRTVTGTVTVVTDDPTNYASDDAKVVAALGGEGGSITNGKGDDTPSNGSMIIYLAESEDENAGIDAANNSLITPTYITAAATAQVVAGDPAKGTATYTFTVELSEVFAYAPGVYYLRVYFEIGEDDNPTPFSETFKVVIE